MTAPLLRLAGLTVRYRDRPVLRDLHLEIAVGEVVGVAGPSGVGKTTLGLAMLGLASWHGARVGGAVWWRGEPMSTRELGRLRGTVIGYLPQEPRPALNPYRTCGAQIADARPSRRADRAARVREALGWVGLDPSVARQYPHRLSGGMCQRVLLAAALVNGPSLLVADEPTANLDPSNRDRVHALLTGLRASHGLAVLLISHDERTLAGACDRVLRLDADQAGAVARC